VTTFAARTRLPVSAREAFDWHARPGAFERLTPPWEAVEVLERHGGIADGARLVMRVGTAPLRMRWVAEHRDWIDGAQFRDVQASGPFRRWEHTHRFEPESATSSVLEDRIDYELPAAPLANRVAGGLVQARLARMFRYRHAVTVHDLAAHRAAGLPPQRILVTGASGLIGRALVPFLTTGGHAVTRLVRGRPGEGEVAWDPARGALDAAALPALDAAVHLAGESIADGRWTTAKKRRILESRVASTRLVAETLAALPHRPRVLVCASAIGIYGDRGAEVVDERAAPGTGFLADVCRAWEAAADPARAAGIRVVHVRFGVVLSAAGGALATMLLPFRMGLGGVVGAGTQYLSWIALDDAVGAVHVALAREALAGPLNAVAPHPVTNREYTRTLGAVLGRPTVVPLPAFAARLALGEMADALLLASTRVEPRVLREAGYAFRFPDLEPALRHLLGV
jgi:uncharacterized protein (TIGR01777 family)